MKKIFLYILLFFIFILCYIIRLPKRIIWEINNLKINNIIENEQNEFISNFDLGKKIPKNKIIIENLLNLHRIINKILLFICGKPGCSKSLSIMILYKSMKGNNGEQNLFKKLPKLSVNGYQGSLSKPSEGIKKIF